MNNIEKIKNNLNSLPYHMVIIKVNDDIQKLKLKIFI
jgi:hypothetical protein